MLFSAGRTPLTESGLKGSRNGGIHWAQESRDQGSMVREWVKWDYELRSGVDLEGVVDRALAITQSEPQGPVYLSLPREVLAEEIESFTYSERPRMQPNVVMASPEAIKEAARLLAQAKNPIVAHRARWGATRRRCRSWCKLAETLNMPVFSGGTYMNFPVTHPLHQGGRRARRWARRTSCCVMEQRRAVDALDDLRPQRERDGRRPRRRTRCSRTSRCAASRSHINLSGAPRYTLEALINALKAEKLDAAAIAERGERWGANHDKVRAGRHATAPRPGKDKTPIDKAWVVRPASSRCATTT